MLEGLWEGIWSDTSHANSFLKAGVTC